MKNSKKIAILAGSIGVALLGSSSSYAAITTDSNGVVETAWPDNVISVSNVESGDTFLACKIVDIKYESSTNTVSYDFTSGFKSFQNDTNTPSDYNTTNLSIDTYRGWSGSAEGAISGNTNIDGVAGAYAKYVRSNNGAGCTAMTVNGTTASSTVSTAGSYLIIPTSSTKVYSAMIANIGVKTQTSGNVTEYVLDSDITADITAKKGNPGSVVKAANGDTFAIGQDIVYTITAQIPTYPANAQNTTFIIKDTPTYDTSTATNQSRGDIIFDTSTTPTVTAGGNTLTANTDYTITWSNSQLIVTIPNTKTLTSPIVITYHAKLTDSAVAGIAQPNGVELQYPTDVYDPNSATASAYSQETVKTLGIKIKKFNDASTPAPLAGAEFQLFTDSTASGTPVTCHTDTGGNTTNTTLTTSSSTGESGVAICRGLAAGTYYLKETKAPAGYVLSNTIYAIEVTEQNASDGITPDSGSATVTTGYKTQQVTNSTANFTLPFTGGRGVIMYAIIGVGIVGVASVYYARKKNQA